MTNARMLRSLAFAAATVPVAAFAQVPDLLTALDAGGRGMGMGGGVNQTASDTLSGYYNPAGLAYLDSARMGLTFRNLPRSTSNISGNFDNPVMATEGTRGANTISHLGYAMPWGKAKENGHRPVVAFTYTLGGYVFDTQKGTNLQNGALIVRNYERELRLRTDYFTLAYAQANSNMTFNWGIGLNYVRQGVTKNVKGVLVDSTNNVVGNLGSETSETGSGVGATIGFQWTPKGNVTYGLSYRTEIDLNGNPVTKAIYDKIPAKLNAGVTIRRDGLRGGRDFLLLGANLQHTFKGKDGSDFDRGSQTAVGLGIEYNMFRRSARIPVRMGYSFVGRSSDDFLNRNGFTMGVGYQPDGSNYALDLNMAFPERGGFDLGLSLSYKLGK